MILVMVAVIVTLAIGFWNHRELSALARQSAVVDVQGSWLASQIAVVTLKCRQLEDGFHSVLRDAGAREKSLGQWRAAHADLENFLDAYAACATRRDQHRQLAALREASRFYKERFLHNADRVDSGELITRDAPDRALSTHRSTSETLVEGARALARSHLDAARDGELALQKGIKVTTCTIGLSAVIVLAVVTALSAWLSTKVLNRIASLTAMVARFISGDSTVRAPTEPQDEIGALAHQFNDMAAAVEKGLARVHREIRQRGNTAADLARVKRVVEAARRAKSELLAHVNSGVRTPATALVAFTEVLVAGLDEDTERGDADEATPQDEDRLLEIIGDVLELSRIEAGTLQAEPVRYSPGRIVEDVASLMSVRAKAKGLSLTSEHPGPLPETILTDPACLRRVLVHLVDNAIEFTETGGVRIVAEMAEDDGHPPKLRLDVIDTGIGMSPQQAGSLFQPSTGADSTANRRHGGSGLGLTIAKRLAEMLGGEITLSSTLGKGSTFSLTIDTGPLEGVQMSHHTIPEAIAEEQTSAAATASV